MEESFQLQATHDLYYFGIRPAFQLQFSSLREYKDDNHNTTPDDTFDIPYDHLKYPGVVPRTFAGPIVLSFLCRFLLLPCSLLNIDANPNFVQFLARFCLMLFNVFGWIRFASAVDRLPNIMTLNSSNNINSTTNRITTGSWLLLITACQFHVPFYSSRMLPNTFALSVVLQSYAFWVENKIETAAALLVMGTTVFRCDMLLLLGPVGLSWLLQRQLALITALKIGILTGLVSLIITVPIDSLLWNRLVWPEGEVFYFNAILGKSTEWGLSPWHWYFTAALPKSMLLTLLLVPFSMIRILEALVSMERRWRYPKFSQNGNRVADISICVPESAFRWVDTRWLRFILPILGFVVFYSFLGHKEMRFIFPAIPMLNFAVAVSFSKLTNLAFPSSLESKDKKIFVSLVARAGFGCGILCLLLTWIGSMIFVIVSKSNYSGGDALRILSLHVNDVTSSSNIGPVKKAFVNVHVDVASAMSGVSLFGQRAAQASTPGTEWKFIKDGYEEGMSVGQDGYEHFTHLLSEDPDGPSAFTLIHTQQGNPRLSIHDRKIVTEDTIYILEKRNWV